MLKYKSFIHRESLNYEIKQHKPWFDDKCSELLNQRKLLREKFLRKSFIAQFVNTRLLRPGSKIMQKINWACFDFDQVPGQS